MEANYTPVCVGVHQLGEKIRHVYFPTESFISLVTALDDNTRLEVGIVDDEGMLFIRFVSITSSTNPSRLA
jgi:hypothetical protein